jgi:hypothetical protein
MSIRVQLMKKKNRLFPLSKTVVYLMKPNLAYSNFTSIKCGSRKAKE